MDTASKSSKVSKGKVKSMITSIEDEGTLKGKMKKELITMVMAHINALKNETLVESLTDETPGTVKSMIKNVYEQKSEKGKTKQKESHMETKAAHMKKKLLVLSVSHVNGIKPETLVKRITPGGKVTVKSMVTDYENKVTLAAKVKEEVVAMLTTKINGINIKILVKNLNLKDGKDGTVSEMVDDIEHKNTVAGKLKEELWEIVKAQGNAIKIETVIENLTDGIAGTVQRMADNYDDRIDSNDGENGQKLDDGQTVQQTDSNDKCIGQKVDDDLKIQHLDLEDDTCKDQKLDDDKKVQHIDPVDDTCKGQNLDDGKKVQHIDTENDTCKGQKLDDGNDTCKGQKIDEDQKVQHGESGDDTCKGQKVDDDQKIQYNESESNDDKCKGQKSDDSHKDQHKSPQQPLDPVVITSKGQQTQVQDQKEADPPITIPQTKGTIFPNPNFDASADCEKLYNAMHGMGTDEKAIIEVLTSCSNAQRQTLKSQYTKQYETDLVSKLKGEIGGDFERLVVALMAAESQPVTSVEGHTDLVGHFATELRNSMTGAGTNDEALIQVVVSRSEVDLADIKAKYDEMFDRSLVKDIKSETSGDYEKLLLKVLGE